MLEYVADHGLLTRHHVVILIANPVYLGTPPHHDLHEQLVEQVVDAFGYRPSGDLLTDLAECVRVCREAGARIVVYVPPQEPERGSAWIDEHVAALRQASVGAEFVDLSRLCPDGEFLHDQDYPTSHTTETGRARVRGAIQAELGREFLAGLE